MMRGALSEEHSDYAARQKGPAVLANRSLKLVVRRFTLRAGESDATKIWCRMHRLRTRQWSLDFNRTSMNYLLPMKNLDHLGADHAAAGRTEELTETVYLRC